MTISDLCNCWDKFSSYWHLFKIYVNLTRVYFGNYQSMSAKYKNANIDRFYYNADAYCFYIYFDNIIGEYHERL